MLITFTNLKRSFRDFLPDYKLYGVLTIAVALFATSANAQWNIQSPLPTYLDIRGVGAPSSERVFIATDDNSFDEGGSLFESIDGGTTWVQRNIPFNLSNPFYGLFFLDSQNGWAYGNDNYRTIDGGTTWTQLPFLGSTYFMKFYTSSFGVATGNFGQYISHDGGDSWIESPNGMFDFDFVDNSTGLGISAGSIYRTTDGGNTFTPVFSGVAEAVTFISNTVAVGIVDGSFMQSVDGGVNWTIGATADGRNRLLHVSDNVVLAWWQAGTFPDYDDRIFRSTDGGLNWTDLGEVMPAGVFAFAVPDSQSVVASDFEGNMFHSANAGLNWTQSFVSNGQVPGYLSSAVPAFANAQTGYFGYGAGVVIKTIDGGLSWFQISSGTSQTLNDIDRFANGNLIAVGDNGTVLTNVGGTSQWVLQPAISPYKIKAVQIVNPTDVVTLDEIGQVYMSSDGGATWTAASTVPPDLSPAEDIDFSTLQDGWVIGQGGLCLHHTSNGGNTWVTVPDFGGAYVSVDAEGANIWANNITGTFYRSIDNGSSWIQGDLPGSPHQIQDMDFYDQNIGYAVGWYGEAFRSADGGATWQVLPTPNVDDQLTDIYLIGPDELWVSTNSNVAYYSANGGQGWAVLDIGSTGFGAFNAIAGSPIGDAWTVGQYGSIEHFSGPPSPPLNQPPTASFIYTANGLSIDFTDTSSDLDGTVVSWLWNFADGTTSSEQNPSHTYLTPDTYWVELLVTDDDGDTGSGLQIITVQPLPGGTFGDFTEVTPLDSIFVTPQDEDFWVITTAPADYDSDGDLDIAVLGYYVVYNMSTEERLMLIVNNGSTDSTTWNFSYIEVPLGTLITGASDMSWGDLDGDGDQDLALGTDGQTVIYRNEAGALVQIEANLPGYWEENSQAEFDLRSITWADFDNDGDMDLLIPSVFNDTLFTYETAMMRNDGPNGASGWNFTSLNTGIARTEHAQSSWADYDGDQDLDLLLVNIAPLYDEGFIRRYRNEGIGTFTGEDILGTLAVEQGEVQWGDYDGDGDLDILVAGNVKELDGNYTPMALRIYRNDNESYVPLEVIADPYSEGWFDFTAATWADYDSDGDMDILLAGNYNSGSNIEGRARIYTNTLGIFTADSANTLPSPRASGDRGGTFSWFDLDGDGDLDYFIAGQYFVPGGNGLVEAQMHIYRNDVAGQNNPPSSPSGLSNHLIGNNTVQLSWIGATDDHTPDPALTYDLELFLNNVPVALADRLPEPGNVSAANEWLLSRLQDGHYEWTLRAVDAAYAGSPIATGEFTIGIPTAVELLDNKPQDFSLVQNFPNPFKSATVIRFYLPEKQTVTIRVFDVLGNEIKTLAEKEYAQGQHDVIFDASGLGSGVYFYSISAGSSKTVKKMLLQE